MCTISVVENLDLLEKNCLKQSFINYYKALYEGWTEQELGFSPSVLTDWLISQFDNNMGEFIVVGTYSNSFLSFTPKENFINVYQMIGTQKERDNMLKFLVRLFPKATFYSVVRKNNKVIIEYLLSKGCKITENRFPNYSSTYYCGVEMSANLIKDE